MNAPLSQLDQRFSDADATTTPWDDVARALDDAQLFWVTTVRRDGRPHMTPLVAVWNDDAVYFCTGPAEQKAVNLRGNQHVILSTGCNRWDEGLDVVVEGDAVRVTDERRLQRLAASWGKKWDGQWKFDVRDGAFQSPDGTGEALVFEVRPAKVLSFTKGHFAATRHRFPRRA